MADLDTELHLLLFKKDLFDTNPSAGKLSIGADDPLYIGLKFSGDIAELERAGFKVGSVVGPIAYGVTNLAGLVALSKHPQVERIQKQRRHHLLLGVGRWPARRSPAAMLGSSPPLGVCCTSASRCRSR